MSDDETRQLDAAVMSYKFIDKRSEDLRVYKQEARWCGRVTARSPTSWASPWLIWTLERHQEQTRRQSWGSPVRRCILAGPSLTTIKNRSGTNFYFLSPLYLSYFISTLLSSHLLLSFYLPCMYIIYIVFLLCCECVCECLTNDLLMRAYFFHS